MKKFLVAFFLIVLTTISVSAEVVRFRTTSYTSKQYTPYGWTEWRPYQDSDMLLTIDFDNDIVTIYSPKTQVYKIISYEGSGIDYDGDAVAEFRFVDQDRDRGTMRLVQRRSGKSEIYISFANVSWCYSVVRL